MLPIIDVTDDSDDKRKACPVNISSDNILNIFLIFSENMFDISAHCFIRRQSA